MIRELNERWYRQCAEQGIEATVPDDERHPMDLCGYCLEVRSDVHHDPILGYVCVPCEKEITEGGEDEQQDP